MGKIIGLTGGIASGKSTVSKILANLGALIIDADELGRRVVSKGSLALEEIKNYFGEEYLEEDGQLNRKKLGTLVFNNPKALEKLNEITHSKIIEEMKKEIIWHKKNAPNTVIIVDAALLIEMNLMKLVDEVWLVAIPYQLQLNRLMDREGLTKQEAENRITCQMSLEDKKKYAHKIIDNSTDIIELEERVKKLWREIE